MCNSDPVYVIFIDDHVLQAGDDDPIALSPAERDYWVSRIAELDPQADVNYLMVFSVARQGQKG